MQETQRTRCDLSIHPSVYLPTIDPLACAFTTACCCCGVLSSASRSRWSRLCRSRSCCRTCTCRCRGTCGGHAHAVHMHAGWTCTCGGHAHAVHMHVRGTSRCTSQCTGSSALCCCTTSALPLPLRHYRWPSRYRSAAPPPAHLGPEALDGVQLLAGRGGIAVTLCSDPL